MSGARVVPQEYLDSKGVHTLFEALTAGLVYHRPEDHYNYINQCLEKIKTIGYKNVTWTTFIEGSQHTSTQILGADNGVTDKQGGASSKAQQVMDEEKEENGWDSLPSVAAYEDDDQNKKSETKVEIDDRDAGPAENIIKKTGPTDKTAEKEPAENISKKTRKPPEKKKRSDFAKKFSWQRHENIATVKDEAGVDDEGKDTQQQKQEVWENRMISENKQSANFTDPQVIEVLRGSFDNTPSLPTNTVRIFLSSTFTDFRAERNMLPKKAFPEIQKYCRERGLDFQVLDMRWGVTDEMMNDHQVTALCIREVKTCQQISCGPNFVTLIGNKYGFRPFPSVIKEDEFTQLIDLAKEQDKQKAELVRQWFRKNDNQVPPDYELQPIASKLEYYNDQSNKEMYSKHRQQWSEIQSTLHHTLQEASKLAVSKGLMNSDTAAKYEISVTEDEIHWGVLKAPMAKDKSICYKRNLVNLETHLSKANTGRFVDTIMKSAEERVFDEEAKDKIQELCTYKIPKAIEDRISREYTVTWNGINLEDTTDEEYTKYLDRFCQDFITDMKDRIDRCIESGKTEMNEEYSKMYFEVVHHIKFSKSKLDLFCGREEAINKIKELVTKETEENIPVIVHGASGYGKTSLLAKCASLIPEWFQTEVISVVRFLGTSPSTSNIRDTIVSILSQMFGILNYTLPPQDHLDKMGDVRRHFWNFLTTLGERHSDTNFVITLDSVDQLSEAYSAHKMIWLPRTLPPNVNIVVSCLSEVYTCLENCKQRITDESQYIALKPLSPAVGEEIIKTYLKLHNRQLTKQQLLMVHEAFSHCSQPLFLKLTLDSTLQWSSYMDVSEISVAKSVSAAISQLFEDLQVKYGDLFVSHALSYLTSGVGGLTDIEMEDVLSCDDQVLNEVYQYHDPPLEGTIRIPALMWARLGSDLREYLTERQVDGKTVKTWYHRQFLETARKIYLSTEWTKQVHSNLAELYQQENGIKRTILLTQRKGKVIENADRLVTAQPLTTSNKRKLNSLSYHLFRAEQKDLLKEKCLLSFDFIFTKLKAIGIGELFSELEDFSKVSWFKDDKEAMIIKYFMEISFEALKFDPYLFPLTVKERLLKYGEEFPAVQAMVDSATKWMKETKKPLLVPTTPINLVGLDTPLRFTSMVGYEGMLSSNEDYIAAVWKNNFTSEAKVQVFDLGNRDLVASMPLQKESPIALSPDDKHVAFIHNHKLRICEMETADLVREISFLSEPYDQATGRAISYTPDGRYIFVVMKLGRPLSVPTDGQWKGMTGMYSIQLDQAPFKICTVSFPSKKHVDKMYFNENADKVITFAREKLHIFSFPELKKEYENKENIKLLHGDLSIHRSKYNSVIIPQEMKKGCRYTVFNYLTKEIKCSEDVHSKGPLGNESSPFGLATDNHMTTTVLGTTARKDRIENYLWVWEPDQDCVRIDIGSKQWKQGSSLAVLPNWKYCIVGWKNGDISVVCMKQKQELHTIHGHAQSVQQVLFYNNDLNMLSLAVDHVMKLWDIKMLISEAEQKNSQKLVSVQSESETEEVVALDDNEQVVSISTTDDYVITTTQLNVDGPRLWNMEKGLLEKELTDKHDKEYKKSLESSGVHQIMKKQRYHGEVSLCGEYMIYIRKQRNHCFIYVASVTDASVLSHKHFGDTFFSIIPSPKLFSNANTKPFMLVVRDDCVEKLSLPTLEVMASVEYPKISVEFENIYSSNTKRKLMYYKTAITIDGKYFIVCNPAPVQKQGSFSKYFDLIEVDTMTNVGRIEMPRFTPWKILEDSIYYLVEYEEDGFQIHKPPTLLFNIEKKPKYICALYDGNSTSSRISKDFTVGLEIMKDHRMRLWDIEDRQKKGTLKGHSAEVNCTGISDNNQFVVSGSFDNSIRLWSIKTGTQLCTFSTSGSIDGIMMTPSEKYVIVNYYSAPQRKRAAILEILNAK